MTVLGMMDRSSDRAAIEAEIDRVRSSAKDLVTRFLWWHIQEQALGGLDADTAKLLDSLARGNRRGADWQRRLSRSCANATDRLVDRDTICPDGFSTPHASVKAWFC
jgi:hypothetical protein